MLSWRMGGWTDAYKLRFHQVHAADGPKFVEPVTDTMEMTYDESCAEVPTIFFECGRRPRVH